jgi:CHASE3 domain sensor protein
MKSKSYNYKILIGLVIGLFIFIPVVFAASIYLSSDVYYNNTNSTLSSTDVQSALDELATKYSKINKKCPDGYTCTQK